MPTLEAERALREAAALGPFFQVDPHPGTAGSLWQPWSALLADPGELPARVATTKALLAGAPGLPPGSAVEDRVAASLTSLGLAARFVSPVLGAALVGGVLPILPPRSCLVGPPGPGPVRMAGQPAGERRWHSPGDLAAAFTGHCLEPVVRPLLTAIGARFGVSAKVLDGNAASAVAGAVHMIVARRPDLTEPATATFAALLREGPLAGTGECGPAGRAPGWRFIRRSCCLLYRMPGATPCGDCVLQLSPAHRRHGAPGAGVGVAGGRR